MILNYENKMKEEEIIDRITSVPQTSFPKNKSFFIEGENFKALSSLLNSGFKESIDLIYIDPPFSTSNDFIISDERTSTISTPKEGILAYSDKLKGAEYLEFLRERLVVMRELLSEKGSIYLHIDYKIGHYVKVLMDEVFGKDNFINDIARVKSNPKNFSRKAYGNQKDLILFYAKKRDSHIFNNITETLSDDEMSNNFKKIELDGRRYNTIPLHAPGQSNGVTGAEWRGIKPPEGRHWRTAPENLDKYEEAGLIEWSKNNVPRLKKYADEHKGKKIQDIWSNFKDPQYPDYPTQKNIEMLELIVKQSSDPDSYVLDAFAGSGTTLVAARSSGRKFIGVDESETSIKVISERFSDIEFVKL